jgi:hypothetical protein
MFTSGRIARVLSTSALVLTLLVLGAGPASAQPAKSSSAAVELMSLLDQSGQDAIAAALPNTENQFVAALVLGGSQLLVVSGEYSAPDLLTPSIDEKNFRDVYVELQGASVPETKVFITDLGGDGLVSQPDAEQPFDIYEVAGTRTAFDGHWREQDLSEDEYMARFTEADERYASMLEALVAGLK